MRTWLLLFLTLSPSLAVSTPPTWKPAALEARFGSVEVRVDSAVGVPRALFGLNVATTGATPEARALDFVSRHGDVIGGIKTTALEFEKVTRFKDERIVTFQLLVAGLPVDGRFLKVQLAADGRVETVYSDFIPLQLVPEKKDVGPETARAIAARRLQAAGTGSVRKVVLAPAPTTAAVAYRVGVARIPMLTHYWVYVRASDGAVLNVRAAAMDQPQERLP